MSILLAVSLAFGLASLLIFYINYFFIFSPHVEEVAVIVLVVAALVALVEFILYGISLAR